MAISMRLATNVEGKCFKEYLNLLDKRLSALASPEEKAMEQKVKDRAVDQAWMNIKSMKKRS